MNMICIPVHLIGPVCCVLHLYWDWTRSSFSRINHFNLKRDSLAFRPNIVVRDAKDGAAAVIEVRWTNGPDQTT